MLKGEFCCSFFLILHQFSKSVKGSLKLPYENPGRPSLFLLWHVKKTFSQAHRGSYSATVIISLSNSAELSQISFVIMFRHFNLYFEACCPFKKNYKKELLISKREWNILMENIAEVQVNANLENSKSIVFCFSWVIFFKSQLWN